MTINHYTVYSESSDMSFLMEDVVNTKGEVVSTEVKGFYYGESDSKLFSEYDGQLKATFE